MKMERMRGVNFGGWFSQVESVREQKEDAFSSLENHLNHYLGKDDFTRVKNWGFDHVRLPVDWFHVFDEKTVQPLEDRLELLGSKLQEIGNMGLKVILDLHRCPGHFFHNAHTIPQEFFTNAKKREDAKAVWSELADRFGEMDHVLLEILNEPVAPDNETWNRVKDEMFTHIRSHAKKSTIVVASNRWNSPKNFADLRPVEDDNALYSLHFYEPILFTHQNAPWIIWEETKKRREYPETYLEEAESSMELKDSYGLWNRSRLEQALEEALKFREKTGLPVSCNEFGTYVQAPAESRMRWMNDILSIFKEADVGFSYWNYRNLDFGIISDLEPQHASLSNYNEQGLDQTILTALQNG